MNKIRKGDEVIVLAGRDKGKRGKVVLRKDDDHVIVEGINIVKKHTRGRMGARQAGVVEQEAPMNASKVMVVCPKCNHGTRIGHSFLSTGEKVRQCRHCGEVFERDSSNEKWGGHR